MKQEHYDGEHPFARPADSDASMFIQWKGTDVCLDFTCGVCNESTHYTSSVPVQRPTRWARRS